EPGPCWICSMPTTAPRASDARERLMAHASCAKGFSPTTRPHYGTLGCCQCFGKNRNRHTFGTTVRRGRAFFVRRSIMSDDSTATISGTFATREAADRAVEHLVQE